MDVSQSSDLSLPKEQTHKSPKQVAKDLQDLFASTESRAQLVEVFQAQIKLYCIGSNEVTSTAENLKMSMMKCTLGGKWNYLSGTFFMCVMENDTDIIWLYPVIPNSTKFYCTDFGALIFPDLESEASSIVGPTIADQAQEEEKRDDSAGIDYQNLTMDGAEDIASTLVKGAEKADSLLTKCTSYITSKMDPPKAPTQVPPSVRATVEEAQNVTYAAADLTERIAEKVGSASQEMGRVLAIHLQKQGSILVKKALGCDSNEANNKVEGAIPTAADAVEGLSIVAGGLEKSASILAHSLSENTVQIIKQRNGNEVGEVAKGIFDTVGNTLNISRNLCLGSLRK